MKNLFNTKLYHISARSLSDVQESAQLLGGEALPRMVLQGILAKSRIPFEKSDYISLVNMTAYDGWVERVCRRWKDRETPAVPFRSLSMTKNSSAGQYVERTLAMELMQDYIA